jgi:hypothetical protein
VLQGVDLQRFRYWEEVVPLFTKGQYPAGRPVSRQGIFPYKVQYLEEPGGKNFAQKPTRWATAIPTLYNADTLGLRPDLVKRPIEHWHELLSPEFKGRAALLAVPSIGIMDAAVAIESRGDLKYADKGNMTPAEIDKTVQILIDLKKAGHFRAFWTTFDESVNLMASGEVVIQSMWSPAVTAVRAPGIPCHYVPLKEGYRAWAVGLCLMAHVKGLQLDAAYEYLNWYLSGWQGGFIAKQGYYSSVPSTAKKFMTADEWDYWYEGKPARREITDPYGHPMEPAGHVKRDCPPAVSSSGGKLSGHVVAQADGSARLVGDSGESYAVPIQPGSTAKTTDVWFAVRRDRIALSNASPGSVLKALEPNMIVGTVHAIEYQGSYVKVSIHRSGQEDVVAHVSDHAFFPLQVQVGGRVMARWGVEDVHLLQKVGERPYDQALATPLSSP